MATCECRDRRAKVAQERQSCKSRNEQLAQGGTFKVARSIWSHPDFAPSEFSEREAFLWLVSEASWKPRRVRAGRVVVDLDRGQLCCSIRFMADAWMWSKSRVSRYLDRLKKRDMIGTQGGTGQLVITICNYDEYQGERDSGGTGVDAKAGHERDSGGTNYKKDEIRLKERETLAQPEADASATIERSRFADFWAMVPRKIGKKATEAAWKRLSRADQDAAKDSVAAWYRWFQSTHRDATPLYPERYLKHRRWEDEGWQDKPKPAPDRDAAIAIYREHLTSKSDAVRRNAIDQLRKLGVNEDGRKEAQSEVRQCP